MRKVLLFFGFLFLMQLGNAQELKKKMLISYTGEIPSYMMSVGEQVVQIPSCLISYLFGSKNKVTESVGDIRRDGVYTILKEDKLKIVINIIIDGERVATTLIYHKKEKRMERKGIYPQPDVFLKAKTKN